RGGRRARIHGLISLWERSWRMSERNFVVLLSFPLLVAACGNDGVASASDGISASDSSTASASESRGGPGPTTCSGAVSDCATGNSVGTVSVSQASKSGPTTGAVSEAGSTSATRSVDSDDTGDTTGQVSGTTGSV